MIGIDTIRLRIRKPILLPGHILILVPPATCNGREINDKYIEHQVQSATPDRDGNPDRLDHISREMYLHVDFIDIRSFSNYMMVEFCVPKVLSLSNNNVNPASLPDMALVFEYLQEWFHDIAKIDVSIMDLELSRLDIFANAQSKYAFPEYDPLFTLLNLRRQNYQKYPGTFYGFSSYQTTCLYDKSAIRNKSDKKNDQLDQSVDGLDHNLIRWEIRLKRAKTISRVLGLHTVSDLLGNWSHVRNLYISQVRKTLRMTDNIEPEQPVPDIRAEISSLARHPADMRALNQWLLVNGARHVSGRLPQVSEIKAILHGLGYHPYQISRFISTFADLRSVRLAGERVSINDLRTELYRKLVG